MSFDSGDRDASDLAAHVTETNRIAEELRPHLRLGPVVKPPYPAPPGAPSASG